MFFSENLFLQIITTYYPESSHKLSTEFQIIGLKFHIIGVQIMQHAALKGESGEYRVYCY